jgi:hypothetical protein
MKFSVPGLESLRESSASQIAEAAVILPMLFMLVLSIYWFGRAFMIYGTINHAAREGVRAAAVPSCANCIPPCAWPGSSLPCDSVIATTVTAVLQAANLDPAQAQPFTPNPLPPACPDVQPQGACAVVSTGQFTICRNVVLNPNSTSPPVCGAIVSFQYPYEFPLPFTSLGNNSVLLKAQAQLGEEN